jgi:membrane associated rhomboid family serine protease
MSGSGVRVILGPVSGGGAEAGEINERLLLFRFASMLARPARATRALVLGLVALHVVIDIISVPRLLGSVPDSADAQIVSLLLIGAKIDALVDAGEWWRLATAPFLHAGVLHLLLNVAALYVIGRIVENALGVTAFLLIYLLGGLAGSTASYLFSDTPSVGASGAIYAILGAAAAYGLLNRARLPERLKRLLVVSPALWILLNVGLSLLIPSIDIAAHAGGLLLGVLLTPLLGDRILERPPWLPAAVRAPLLGATVLLVAASLSIMAPRLLGKIPSIATDLTSLRVGSTSLAVPTGWSQGVRRGRECVVEDGAGGRGSEPRAKLTKLCIQDCYGAVLWLISHPDLHLEERRIVTGRPSRTPSDPYLLRLTGARAPPVFRRRDQGVQAYTVLVAPGPRRHAYVLQTWTTMAPHYVPLMSRLTMSRFEDIPPP